MTMHGISLPSAGRDRARPQGCVRVQQRLGVVEGRVRRDARDRRRPATAVYVFTSGDLTLTVHSDPASFADMRWVYPRLPSNGRGKLDLELTWRGSLQDYLVHERRHHGRQSARHGQLRDHARPTRSTIHDTDLRFSGVDTRTARAADPTFHIAAAGRVRRDARAVSGGQPRVGAQRRRDVRRPARRARAGSSPSARSGFLGRMALRARDLRVQMLPVQVDMARTWMPNAAGRRCAGWDSDGQWIELDGSLLVVGDVDHADRGTRSRLDGTATVQLAGGKRFDVDVDARPVSLVEVGRFFPAAGLQGEATGPMRVDGHARPRCAVQADLRLPEADASRRAARWIWRAGTRATISTSSLYTVNLRTIDTKAPGDIAHGERRCVARPRLRSGDDARDDRRRSRRRRDWDTHRAWTRCRCARRSPTAWRIFSSSTHSARTRRRRRRERSGSRGHERARSTITSTSIHSAR